MSERTHTDIALRAIFRFSRFLGTFPFDDDFKVDLKTTIRSISVYVIFSTSFSFDLFNSHARRIIKILFLTSANLLSFGVLIARRDDVNLMYRSLQKVETDMTKDGIRLKWLPSHSRLYFSFYVYTAMLVFTAYAHYDPLNIYKTFLMLMSYTYAFSMTLSIISQYSTLQALLCCIFDKLLESKNASGVLVILTNLRSACTAVKSIYGLQILFYTTAIFIFAVCNTYYEFRCEHSLMFKIVHRVWILIISYPVVDIIVSSSHTVTKARKVNEKLYEKMLEDIVYSPNQNELLEFHLTCGNELEFNACGFFRLDNSLICSMIACATTYMVILMQYTNPVLACGRLSLNSSENQTSA